MMGPEILENLFPEKQCDERVLLIDGIYRMKESAHTHIYDHPKILEPKVKSGRRVMSMAHRIVYRTSLEAEQ